jgi:Macrocin-O-methyltransferase (TylF)
MGLSAPHPEFDSSFWEEGTYSASRQIVETNLRVAERPRIQLIEGFFADSLLTEEATAHSKIAFARIDCDIYEPSCQCLRYLANRLAHGSVPVLDDWPNRIDIGEGRAFAEWVPSVPHLKFEFLFLGTWGHLYIRVWHRDRPVFSDEHAVGPAVVASSASIPLETISFRSQTLAAGHKALGRISKLLRSD